MSWALHAKRILSEGREVTINPKGNSMSGRIESGQSVLLKPCTKDDLNVNDVVLCKVKGNDYLHLISAIDGERYQISNNKGHINGWISLRSIFGKAYL